MAETDGPRGNVLTRFVRRLLGILGAAVVIGTILHFVARAAHGVSPPADFKAGVLHGVLMPLALPNLLVGDDVTIYAQENIGRPYKLGYTVGVNGCGLLFFGFFFWRVRQWRRQRPTPAKIPDPPQQNEPPPPRGEQNSPSP
jgi:hypothetical protein